MVYPDDIDPEVVPLCDALNAFPGVATCESCSGHESDRPIVVFTCNDLRSLHKITVAMNPRERFGWQLRARWASGNDVLIFLLETRAPVPFAELDALADELARS